MNMRDDCPTFTKVKVQEQLFYWYFTFDNHSRIINVEHNSYVEIGLKTSVVKRYYLLLSINDTYIISVVLIPLDA